MFDEHRFNKELAFQDMKRRGIAKIELEFSGGHDEGGIDSTIAYDENGNVVELPKPKYYISTRYSQGGSERGFYEPGNYSDFKPLSEMPADERELCEFVDNIQNIVYSKYYSFAGEFYVYGTATIDAVNKTASIDGQETVENYESFSEVF